MSNQALAFTAKSTSLQRSLTSPVEVFISGTKFSMKTNGIWDTGATNTAITSHVVKYLGLIPSGKTKVNTASGTAIQDTYLIDIGLPNSVIIKGIVANEVPALPSNNEVLVGMDVISMGDFSITNKDGCTCFSFRVPSMHEIDYVKDPTMQIKDKSKKPKWMKPSSGSSYSKRGKK